MNSIIAKRPKGETDRDESTYTHACQTCWATVLEPCIKGIWFHLDEINKSGRDTEECTNLIPINSTEVRTDVEYKCNHEYRRTEDMTGAVKCKKCGHPLRTVYYSHVYGSKFHCFDCKQDFKLMKVHIKKDHAHVGLWEFSVEK